VFTPLIGGKEVLLLLKPFLFWIVESRRKLTDPYSFGEPLKADFVFPRGDLLSRASLI